MEEQKSVNGHSVGWGGRRVAGPGKKMGRPPNRDKALPTAKKKQFILYPGDIEGLESLLAGNGVAGSVLVRGLIRLAETLPAEEILRLVEMGEPPR